MSFKINIGDINLYKDQIRNRFEDYTISVDLLERLDETMLNVEQFKAESFEEFSLEEIFTYLKASHKYYLDWWIPKLENSIDQLVVKFAEDYWSVRLLSLFLTSYKNELMSHIELEEKVLFSYVDNMLDGKVNSSQSELVLNHFINTHNDNVVIHLNELKKDILTFDADLEGNLLLEVLFNQLTLFQRDLLVHGLIEDQVFLTKIMTYKCR